MDRTKAAKHDERSHPAPAREEPQGRTYGSRQPEHFTESTAPLDRYLGNNYVQALAGKKQRLQTKLMLNESGDSYEHEADRVADQLLATPTHHEVSGAAPRIQRLAGQSHGQVNEAPTSVGQALTSPGSALEPTLRQDMEQRFGYDFSTVRLHTGAAAEQSAEDMNAHAYTVGHDIVLGPGRFDSSTHEGRRLIAHELTHVVQQSSADGNGVHQSNNGCELSANLISPAQPLVTTTLQRKVKRPQGNSPPQQPVKGKPSRQTGSNKVAFTIHFDKPLTRSQFIELADITVYGRPTPGEWKGVPDQLKASDSPVVVWVPASTLESELRSSIAALPPHIHKLLMANKGGAESYEDLQSVVNAGFLLEVAGVTEDELELALLDSSKTETSDLVSWAQDFLVRRQEQAESERQHAEREQRREAEEKELEKWRKRFAKYPDAVLDKKIAELRKEPESGSAKDWLPRYEKERARRRDVRRAQPVTRPETVDQAVSMLEEAWRDAEKEDVPDVKRALELVSHIDEWLQQTASSDKYDRYFKDGMFRTVARQTVGMTKDQIHTMRFKLRRQGEDNWNRPTHLGGHWELGVNSLKAAREYLEVMGAKKTLEETSLHGLQEASSRATKYAAAGYAAVILAPVVIGAGVKAAPFLTTHALTGAGLRVAPRLMLWAGRHPVFATAIGTGVAETVLQVGQDKYLDPFQLIFSLLHIYTAMPGRGTPAPNAPRPEGEPEFIITGNPKVDQQTGKVTASAIEQSTGRRLDAEVDVTTGLGRVTDGKTGQVVGNIDLTTADIRRQAPSPAAPPPASIAPAPTLTARQGGGQGSGAARGMLRDVDVSGPGVQVPASHTVFKNKPVANDAPAPAQSQVSKVAVNAPNDLPHGQTIRTAQQPPAPGQKNVEPIRMANKPPTSNPPGQPVRSPTTTPPAPPSSPTARRSGSSEGQTHRAHPRLIPRAPAEGAPPSPAPEQRIGQMIGDEIADLPPVGNVPLSRDVNRNVVPRSQLPTEQATPPPPPTSSRQPGSPDDFEDAPTLIGPRHEPARSLVRRSGHDTDEHLRVVTGEITEPPSGTAPIATGTAREPLTVREGPQPQSGSPQPIVRQPAVSSEPSAPARVSKTPHTVDRFDFQSLPVPEQHRGARDKVQIFGTQIINWGAGPKEAQALTTMLQTNPNAARAYIENLRGQGVTREMARAWADAYRHEHQRGKQVARTHRVPVNETPESRVTLMDLIAGLL